MSSKGFPKSMTTYSYMVCMAKANDAVSRRLTEGTSVSAKIQNSVIARWHVQQERDLRSTNVSSGFKFPSSGRTYKKFHVHGVSMAVLVIYIRLQHRDTVHTIYVVQQRMHRRRGCSDWKEHTMMPKSHRLDHKRGPPGYERQ